MQILQRNGDYTDDKFVSFRPPQSRNISGFYRGNKSHDTIT